MASSLRKVYFFSPRTPELSSLTECSYSIALCDVKHPSDTWDLWERLDQSFSCLRTGEDKHTYSSVLAQTTMLCPVLCDPSLTKQRGPSHSGGAGAPSPEVIPMKLHHPDYLFLLLAGIVLILMLSLGRGRKPFCSFKR